MATETYPEAVFRIAGTLPAEGPLTKGDVEIWAKWHLLLDQILKPYGLTYRGESFKDQGWSTLLVVKLARDVTPLVVFVTERGATGCMRVFLRQLEENRLELREDKFA